MNNILHIPQGDFAISRYPKRSNELLRGWDAADEYLLEYIDGELNLKSDCRTLIINDSFGALTVALNLFDRYNISDSFISQQSARQNIIDNNLSEDNLQFTNSLEIPAGTFDLIVIKVPKTLALLEDQLIRLQNAITPTTKIIIAGMIKSLPKNVWKLLEKLIGSTTTSLAKKKARLIFAHPDSKRVAPPSPYPTNYQLENTDFTISNHANVFSRASLDIGTRFLIKHLPQRSNINDIIDLGCGNGVVGLLLAEKHSKATIHFVDESFMAITSAKQTIKRAWPDRDNVFYHVNDALTEFEPNSADLIVCNPPFHQQHAKVDQTAARMFQQSHNVLREGGELWVIGNHHLHYQQKLNRLFGNSTTVASDRKFLICKAIKKL